MIQTDFLSPETEKTIKAAQADILRAGNVLGIFLEQPKVYFEKGLSKRLEKTSIDPVLIDKLVKERTEARKTKNWQKADKIRKQLQAMNVTVEDRPEGTVWKIND
jgi:cysteinyl-tRNA synthetase